MESDVITINGVEVTPRQLHEIIARRIWKGSEHVTTTEATEEVADLLVRTFVMFSVNARSDS